MAFEVDENGERAHLHSELEGSDRQKRLVRGDGPAFSPTSNRLVFRRHEKGLDVVYRINSDGSGLSAIARVPIERRQRYTYLSAPSWAPDGTRVAFGVKQFKIYRYPYPRYRRSTHKRDSDAASTGASIGLGSGRDAAPLMSCRAAIDPGERIDKQLHLSETVSAQTQSEILEHTSPSWSPTGKQVGISGA